MGLIYLATCTVTGQQYVGLTMSTLVERWAQHVSQARQGKGARLHAAIRTHGADSFGMIVLHEAETLRELNELEQLEIGDRQPGLNTQRGGGAGRRRKFSKAHRRNMSRAAKKRGMPEATIKAGAEASKRRWHQLSDQERKDRMKPVRAARKKKSLRDQLDFHPMPRKWGSMQVRKDP